MLIADLHIHSHYSRATSRDLTPEMLDLWGRRKGLDVIGTGDFTHPAWREELGEKLEHALDGHAFGQRRLMRAFPKMRSIQHHQALQRLRRRMERKEQS